MVSEDSIAWYKWIWTTHASEYFLVKTDVSPYFLILHVTEGPPHVCSSLVIEDDEMYEAVQQKMVDEGIPIIDLDEYDRLCGRYR
jgi:hypothetical protein